jgi:hypothetical protein
MAISRTNSTANSVTSPWKLGGLSFLQDPSILRGGPFYRAQLAAGLIKEGEWNHIKRVVITAAVVWLPLVLLTALFNREGLASLLTSYRVYSRLLIAIPVLLIGQQIMEARFRMIVQAIIDARLLSGEDLKRMDEIIASLTRLRDSLVPEAMVVILLVAHTLIAARTEVDTVPWLADVTPTGIHLTAAGWYAVVVSSTVFQFLLGLSLWKWLLWTVFAFRLSRLNLNLIATHPDGNGGLGFLAFAPVAFTPIAFAATAAIGASWRHEILAHGAKLMSFRLDAIVLLVIVAIVALGPLAFFVPRLAALRRQGMLDYGVLGQIQSSDFHDKWVRHLAGHEPEFLNAPESSTLTDYGSSYENVSNLKPFPVDREALIGLAISVAIPLLPVILAVVPLSVVVGDLLKAMR